MKVSKKLKSIISAILLIAMVITLLPNGQIIKAAEGMNVNIHFYDKDKAYAGKVYMQYWQPGTATVSTKEEDFADWNVKRYPLESETETEGEDWYGLNLQGSVEGFQFLDETGKQNTNGSVYLPGMKKYQGDLYYMDGKWYTENPVKNKDAKEAELNVKTKDVFYLVGNIANAKWSATDTTYPLTKNEDGTYSIVLKDVPAGDYAFKVLQDPENFAWNKAWGGEGSGGNYELTVKSKSNVTITMDPADTTHKLTVKTEASENSDVKSPIYNADGTVTFQYVSNTTGASIGVRGNVKTTKKKSVIKAEPVEKLKDGSYLYVATSAAIKAPGLYRYNFYEMTEKGELGKELGDPNSTTLYSGTGAFVRNPVISSIGLVTIYYPYDGKGAQVYYKSTSSSNKEVLKPGDKVTKTTAKEYGYTVVDMKEDSDFSGGGMYSAKFYDKEDTYSYVLVKDDVVVEDVCNYTENTFKESNVDEIALTVDSPVVMENGSTVKFMYYNKEFTSGTMSVAGEFNSWTKDVDKMTMDKDGKGIWSVEIKNLTPGLYQYKFVQNGSNWMADPLAKMSGASDGNSAFVVPGFAPETALQVEKGKSVTLPKEVLKYTANVKKAEKTEVTYKLKDETQEGVSLKDGVLSVTEDYKEDTVQLILTDGKVSSTCSVEVVGKMYTYTIHYYAQDNSTYADRDMWIWEQSGKAYNTGYAFNKDNYKDSKGRTWATATYSFPTNAINVIVRSKGGWTYQEDTRAITLPEGKESGEFWILQEGSKAFSEYADEFDTGVKRYIVVEYDRPEKDYKGWNFYTWNATAAYNEVSNLFTEVNGKYQTTITIDEHTTNVGYLLRSGTPTDANWTGIEKDMEGDRSIKTPLDQKVIKVKLKQGSLEAKYVPYNKGYELDPDNKQIKFYYRDDDLYLADTLDTLKSVKLEVAGKTFDMTYNKENERYEYTLKNAINGTYEYSYNVTPASGAAINVLDAFNSKKNAAGTKSILEYKDLTTKVAVTCTNSSISCEENTLIGVSLDNPEVKVEEAYADLTALGGNAKTAIDSTLMTLSVGVKDSVPVGKKTIPVYIKDQYGKTHKGSVNITVKQRIKTDDKDFDWDESVVYFMVTDRFCDGNKANNDAYGVGDYDLKGTSSYHGGDFAGVTSKLDYLKNLGINTIWITPVVENVLEPRKASADGKEVPSYGYHGYWASNFEKLNKHLGTVDEFHTLIDEAHARGIRIMVDVVLNHSGYGTKELSQFAGMYRDKNIDGNDILGEQDGLPDFATEREDVRNKLISWQIAWVSEIGMTSKGNTIDYFRVDTVKHVDQTTWTAFKNAMTEYSSKFKMIGEYYGASPSDDFGMLHDGKMDSLLDFSFNDMAEKFVDGNLESMEAQFETRNSAMDNVGTFGSFLNSHDEEGFKTKLEKKYAKEKDASEKADSLSKVAASLSITAKGQPVIYYGEEIGLTGENNYPYQTNRYDMKFDNLNTSEKSMLTHYQTLLKIRNDYSKLFAKGNRTYVAGSDKEKYIAFERSYKGENAVVALNIANTSKNVTLIVKDFAGKVITDAYSGKQYTVNKQGKVEITIPANSDGGTAILFAENSKATDKVMIANLMQARKNGTTLVVNGKNEKTGNNNITWTFFAKDLQAVNAANLKDIDLQATVSNASENAQVKAILKKDKKNADGALLSLAHTGTLQVNAKIKVDLSTQSNIAYGNNVYVYRVSGTKLQQLANSSVKVTKDGYVTLYVAQGGDYVLLKNKPSDAVVTTLPQQVKVSVNSTIKVGKKANISIVVPSVSMQKVKAFDEDNMKKLQSAQVGVKITYSISNKNVATVSSSGVIKGKKKGQCIVSIQVQTSDGQKKVIKKKVTIK